MPTKKTRKVSLGQIIHATKILAQKPPKGTRRVKAWAVVDTVLAKAHGTYLLFNPALSMFSLAIFTHEDFARRYADSFKGKLRLKVLPIDLSLPLPKKSKKK